MFRNVSIRDRLFIWYTFLFMMILLTGSLILHRLASSTLEAQIEQELSTATERIVDMVGSAAGASVRNYLRSLAEKNVDILTALYREERSGRLEPGEAKRLARLIILSQRIGSQGYLYVVDSRGAVVLHPREGLIGSDVSEYAFIRNQMHRKEGFLSYEWANPGDAAPRPKVLYMSYFEPWDWIVSVSAYREELPRLVNVEDFSAEVLGIEIGGSGYSFIVDGEGNFIIHPFLSGNYREMDDEVHRKVIEEIVRRKEGRLFYSWANPGETEAREKYVIFRPLPELGWIIASTSYREELLRPLRHLTWIFFVWIFVSVLLTLPFSLKIGSTISRPIETMVDRFREGAEGNFSVRIGHHGNDEVGRLCRYFDGFMERLEAYRNELNSEIDRRRRREEELQESREHYRGVFENVREGLVILDGEGQIVDINPSALGMFGRSIDEIRGYSFRTLIHDDRHSRSIEEPCYDCLGAIATREPFQCSTRGSRADGSALEIIINGIPYQERERWGTLVVVRDISRQVSLEEQLRHAQKMEAIGTLAGGIAHDFNNILTAVVGFTQLIEVEAEEIREVRDQTKGIKQAVARAKELIQKILTFSKQIETHRQPVRVNRIVGEALELLRVGTGPGVRLDERIEPDCGEVLADPIQLHQVVMNLATNALQAMEEHGGVLRIEVRTEARGVELEARYPGLQHEAGYVLISVRDTGIGIDRRHLARIFDPFFSTKQEGKGTGLGLALVHGIVTDLSGHIFVNSEQGMGTEVRIYLPRYHREVTAVATSPE